MKITTNSNSASLFITSADEVHAGKLYIDRDGDFYIAAEGEDEDIELVRIDEYDGVAYTWEVAEIVDYFGLREAPSGATLTITQS